MSRPFRAIGCFVLFVSLVLTGARVFGPGPASAGGGPTTIYVDTAATGANDGTSWANGYTDLQTALIAAASGTEIWVAEGTYTPGADRTSTFQLKDGVELYGGFPQRGGDGTMESRDPWRYTTTLSGDIGVPETATDNCYHVLTGNGTDSTAVVDGFCVTAGQADGMGESRGGGMLNASGSPTIRNVVFLRNYATTYGGAIANSTASPAMENVIFYGNRSVSGGGAVDNYKGSDPEINNALFVGNTSSQGGALNNEISSLPVLRHVTIVANEAEHDGGGISADGTSGVTVMNTIVWANVPDQMDVAPGDTSVYASIVQGGCPTGVSCDNVRADDPQFLMMPRAGVTSQAGPPPPSWGDADDNYGDLRLHSESPAIDSGNNTLVPPGIGTDLMGSHRLADGGDTSVTAMGGGGFVVDLGAYEAPPLPIYVDGSAAGANSGYTWTDAFTDLQDAFLWGRSGVAEIWVAVGTYLPGDLRTSTFQLLNRMEVYGGFPPGGGDGTFAARDLDSFSTSQLSGNIGVKHDAGDNVYHVVTASDVGGPTLDGFTISDGRADGDRSDQRLGGGIYAPRGHPELRNLLVHSNFAADGGGGAYFMESDAGLTDVHFVANDTDGTGGGLMLIDGGMFVLGESSFSQNRAESAGGGLFATGHVTIRDIDFTENSAPGGGGVYLAVITAEFERTRFIRNSADDAGGGLLSETFGEVALRDSLFAANRAADEGGALAAGNSTIALRNVTVSGNTAGVRGGGLDLVVDTSADVDNTILWGNLAAGVPSQSTFDETSALVTDHSIIEGGCPTDATCTDTMASDPLFYTEPDAGTDGIWGTSDDEEGDLRVWKFSPAIDAGDNDVSGLWALDLAHNPRRVDVDSAVDTGNGIAPIVDIGAYESPPDVIHVDQAASGAYSGLTWTDAFTDVQDALAWALSGPADIWVAEGTYTPGDERDDAFHLMHHVGLYGGFPTGGGDGTFEARDWRAYPTALSGEIGVSGDRSDNCYHVLVGRSVDQTARVDGFHVTRGSADVIPWLSPVRVTCEGDTDYGGGLCLFSSEPVLTRLTFSDNHAQRGGAAVLSESSPILANVEFLGNQAGANGGALHAIDSEVDLINAMFAGNHAGSSGGAMWNEGSSLVLLNASLSGNHAAAGGVASNESETVLHATNAVIWGNASDVAPDIASGPSSKVILDYSLVEGGCPAGAVCEEVRNVDPDFLSDPGPGGDGVWGTADDDLGDLRLQPVSPAIDAGDGDPFPTSITVDLLGNPRRVDVPSVPNTGRGDPPIDIGAYEFVNASPVAVDDNYTTSMDIPLEVAAPGVLENDTDLEGDTLSAIKDSDPVVGTLVLKSDGFFVYTPAPGATGVVTFTYHAYDGTSSSNVATVSITVGAGNQPPTISDIPDQITRPGTSVGPIAFTIGDAETPAAELMLSAESSDTALVPLSGIDSGGSGANRTVTVTPAPGLTGAATITVTVDDGTDTASDSFVLAVGTYWVHLPIVLRE